MKTPLFQLKMGPVRSRSTGQLLLVAGVEKVIKSAIYRLERLTRDNS